VVEVTDMGRLDDGTTFLVMEYLQGVELAEAVSSSGPFAPDRALKVACQLCDALTAVHETGIVHRDLKPENLFLIAHEGSADFVKVLDFGVCKLLEGAPDLADPDQPPLTRTNASLGTPQYMAPEQFQNSAGVDHRADIHAVGAILYFMLTGRPPFDAPTMGQLFMRICVEPPPPLLALRPELPPALDAVLRRALSKQPDDRHESAAALKAALLPFADLRASEAPAGITLPAGITNPTLATTRDERPDTGSRIVGARPSWLPPRSRWLHPLLAAALVLGLITTVVAWGAGGQARDPLPGAMHKNVSSKPQDTPGNGLTLELPAATAATTEPQSPLPAAAPQSPRPRPKAVRPAAAAPAQIAIEHDSPPPAVGDSQAPEPAATPAPAKPHTESTETEASYRFPRRALKDVF
jgi:serine/threonine protein kinase